MSWSVVMSDPSPPRSTNERPLVHDDLELLDRPYEHSHQHVFKRVQPRSGFSIMTSSVRDKSFAESYDNGSSPLSHVERYIFDLHKRRSSGVTVWEYDVGAPAVSPADAPTSGTAAPRPSPTQPASSEQDIPAADVLNEHTKRAFAALAEQSIEPTFDHLYTELKKQKLGDHVIAYILDNMMMHNLMRSLNEQSLPVTDETLQAEMTRKDLSDSIRERVLRRFAAWNQAK